MPPKKSTVAASSSAGESGAKAFSWTPENERKLFLFMIGTTGSTQEDYEFLAAEVFKGTTPHGVKQKVCKLRQDHRALYEEYGKTPPDGKPAPKTPGTPKGKKRTMKETEGDDTPTPKKGRKSKAAVVKKEDCPGNSVVDGIKVEDSQL